MQALALILLLLAQAQAGNRVGNGGNVAVCPDKIQLLDFFEAGGFDFDLAPFKAEKQAAIVNGRLEALFRLAPELARQYQRRAGEIGGEWDVKTDVQLVKVDDSLHAFAPAGKDCKIEQIAMRLPELNDGKRFVVNERLWRRLSEPQRAGLVLHEIVYEHLYNLGAADSRNARKIVALMFSSKFSTMTSGDFWLFIKGLKIPLYPPNPRQ